MTILDQNTFEQDVVVKCGVKRGPRSFPAKIPRRAPWYHPIRQLPRKQLIASPRGKPNQRPPRYNHKNTHQCILRDLGSTSIPSTRIAFPTAIYTSTGELHASRKEAFDLQISHRRCGECSRQNKREQQTKYMQRRNKRQTPPSPRHHPSRWERGVINPETPCARRKPRRTRHQRCHAAYFLILLGNTVKRTTISTA